MQLKLIAAAGCVALAGCGSGAHPTQAGLSPSVSVAPSPAGTRTEADVAVCKLSRYLIRSSARAAPVEALLVQEAAKRGAASRPLRKDAAALAAAYLNPEASADAAAQAGARVETYCAPLGVPIP
jgi:hypothetical protein